MYSKIPNDLPNLYCLTSDNVACSHSNQIEIMCMKGVKLIQLRAKSLTNHSLMKEAKRAVEISNHFETTLIINDSLECSARAESNGVHLGKRDFSITLARRILGDEKLIGETIHSMEEAWLAKKRNVSDYVGIGPFRRSPTKSSLFPELGPKDFLMIAEYLSSVPTYLIGGLNYDDFYLIKKLNLAGICICSSLSEGKEFGVHLNKFVLEAKKYISKVNR